MVAPANDNFADRQVITGTSGQVTVNVAEATREPGEWYSTIGATVWYEWTCPTPAPAVMRFDTLLTDFTTFPDTLIVVYTGADWANLTEVAFGDDTDTNTLSVAEFTPTAGTRYFIQLGTYRGRDPGTPLVLRWSEGTGGGDPDPGGPYVGPWEFTPPLTLTREQNYVTPGDPFPAISWQISGWRAAVYRETPRDADPYHQNAFVRECMLTHAVTMRSGHLPVTPDSCPPIGAVENSPTSLPGLFVGVVTTWSEQTPTSLARYQVEVFEGVWRLDLRAWLRSPAPDGKPHWASIDPPAWPDGAIGMEWESTEASLAGPVQFNPLPASVNRVDRPVKVQWRSLGMGAAVETGRARDKTEVESLQLLAEADAPAAAGGWTASLPAQDEVLSGVVWPAGATDGDPGVGAAAGQYAYVANLGMRCTWTTQRPRHRFIFAEPPPQPRPAVPPPLRVRQRGDGLGLSAPRVKGPGSRQASPRVRGYL